jgi:coproporphyrinogen III oxidase
MEISRENISGWLQDLQDQICNALETADGKSRFRRDAWTRTEGGGGITKIIADGEVIENGGVLFSAVEGATPEFLYRESQHSSAQNNISKGTFFATGVSIVIHPVNPLVPIIHMNVRYFETTGASGQVTKWLGGGIDLTPHYINEQDAYFFHSELKKVCDRHNQDYYTKFKKWADDYFFIPHRNETRGVGGIFFDRLNDNQEMTFEKNLMFWKDVGTAFAPVYLELIRRNRHRAYTDRERKWQLLRRGRYVEFNLIYDKGTRFGLESNGRVESILMSLPKLAGWEYDYQPEQNSDEQRTLSMLIKGRDWVQITS